MILKETDFKKHISQKNFSNLYFIDGEEKRLVKAYTDLLVKKLMGDTLPDFNYHDFDDDSDISQVSVAVNVAPFMSDINCVKISDIDLDSMSSSDIDSFMKILKDVPDTTVLIITMITRDKPQKMSKNYKAVRDLVDKTGVVASLDRRSELSLEKTLCKWAKESGSKMSELCAHKLISTSTNDLNILHSEVEKLSAYADGGEITEEMIQMLVPKNLSAKIYDMFDYVISENFDKAMNTIDILFYQRETATSIVITLGLAYVDMYRAKVAIENGISTKAMADQLSYKNRAWVLDKMTRQSRRISITALRDSIDAILDVNERLVSVTTDARTEIEKLISRLILIKRGAKDA